MAVSSSAPWPARHPAVAWLLALTVLFIVYASLFPFEFDAERLRLVSEGGWRKHLTWRRPVRSDLLANLIFYLPFGALAAWIAPSHWSVPRRWLAVLGAGVALSCTIELAQFATRNRDPALADLLLNALGTGLAAAGALAVRRLGLRLPAPELREGWTDPLALLLVVLWFAFHAAPFMPSTRLMRAADAAELLLQDWSVAAVAAYCAGFVILGTVLRSLLRPANFWATFAACAAASLVARMAFRGHQLEIAECIGLLLALPALWYRARAGRVRGCTVALAWAGCALALHAFAAPFGFHGGPPEVGTLRALGLIHRTGAAEPAVLETAFLYGGLVWLASAAGRAHGRTIAWLLTAAMCVELLQGWQLGRSAHLAAPLAVLVAAALAGTRKRGQVHFSARPRQAC